MVADGLSVHHLADAVRRGDLAESRRILDARPELVNTDLAENNEHRAIHYAVFARSPEMVRLLMAHGADARKGIYPHRNATTALTIARERGYDELVAIIHEEEARRRAAAGADAVTTSAPDELNALIVGGHVDRALAMLENEPALARSISRDGWTPLHAAAAIRDEGLVARLLDHGADVNRAGPRNIRPVDLAAGRGVEPGDAARSANVVRMLLGRGAAMTAQAAVALGDADWLRARHAVGALENPIEDWGGLLTIAVLHDRPEMLSLLLDLGLDPDERVRLRDVEETIWSRAMPLWNCAAHGKLEMAETLLRRGANPNVHVYASGTPVYSAFRHGDRAMVELLQRYGGIVDPVTVGLFREREMAARLLADEAAGRSLPAGILEGRNVSEDLLRGSADSGDAEIVRMSLPGVDWPRDDDRWFWILMQAVWAASPECLALLLARCDANLRHPRFGRTILHDVAALGGEKTAAKSAELAAMLLDAGAWTGERDDVLKSTPLGWACRWGRIDMVKLLLARGADPVEADAEPWASPRAWAAKMGHAEAIDALERARPA